jgi:DNA polymerase/3'-5' exonuclease PolX
MQTTTEKRPHSLVEIKPVAQELVELLRPVTTRIEIAGSIRRRKPTCSDIEIVCAPLIEQIPAGTLFDDDMAPVNRLDDRVVAMLVNDELHGRLDKNGRAAIGSRYKRLLFKGYAVDLFVCLPPTQWGVLMAIRTGPKEFAHAFVTNRGHKTRPLYAGDIHDIRPGLLPVGMRVGEGNQLFGPDGRLISTPTEEAFFEAIGQRLLDPWRRA